MARPAASHIHDALRSLLPPRRIRELARELSVVQRRRKLDIVALVYALALGFSVGDRRTLSGLRRTYLRATGSRLAPSSFHARFNASMVKLVRALTVEALGTLARARPRLRSVLAPFLDVLLFDLGFYRAPLLLQIERHGGYFLSRARKHANPTLVACHRAHQQHLVGMKLLDVLPMLGKDTRDAEAEMTYLLHHRRRPHDLLDLLLCRRDRGHRQRRIVRFLRAEANDPNRARIPLPCRAQAGVLRAR